MIISLESQALMAKSRTGVGWYTYNIIKNVIDLDKDDLFEISIFDFLGRNNSQKRAQYILGESPNYSIKRGTYFPYGLLVRYPELFSLIPYHSLLGSKADISHFFNFVIPKNIKSKTILTVHDMVYKLYPETMSKTNFNISRKNLERSCRDCDVIITVSENSKKEISEFMKVPLSKIEVTYNAVDTELYYPRSKEESREYVKKYNINRPYILYLGTLEPRKNIPVIIKAFKAVAEKNNDIDLVIAGGKGWNYEAIFECVKEQGLQNRVIFTGYVDEEDKPYLYSGSELFVFPSLYEGFGIPPLEAMACGIPVIVSDTSSLPEVVGNAGILVKPDEVDSLAYEMSRVLDNEALKKQLSDNGLVQSKKFSWEDSARKIIDVYHKLK